LVQDIKASTAWYREHLGFERLYGHGWPGVKAAFIGRGALRIELFQNERATPMAMDRRQPETNLQIGGINHFAIEVMDLGATVKALEEKGVSIVSPP
jgi:catechol 2,3-dioxygenase-like lactoylglutathione lyase family enzyme